MKIAYDKEKGKIHQVLCQECKRKTRHIVLASVDASGTEDWGGGEHFHWVSSHQVIQCQGCETICFRIESSNSEDAFSDGETLIHEDIFPRRATETINAKHFMNLPFNLSRIYRETIECYNNDILTLCSAGVRTLVEGICLEKKVLSGKVEQTLKDGKTAQKRRTSLEGKINGLAEKGILTNDNAKVLHEHRFLGNRAVHQLEIPSKAELSLAIEIVEGVLQSIYEIPAKGIELKNQLSRNK